MPNKIQLETLRWLGLMGHRFAVIEPDPRTNEDWRCVGETCDLAMAVQWTTENPERRVFQKVGKRVRGGAVRETWHDVTPVAA